MARYILKGSVPKIVLAYLIACLLIVPEAFCGSGASALLPQGGHILVDIVFIISVVAMIGYWIFSLRRSVRHRTAELEAKNSELLKQIKLVDSMISNTTDAVFVKDSNGKYILINDAGARMVGKCVSEITGHDDRSFFPEDVAGRIIGDDKAIMDSGCVRTYEEEIKDKGGKSYDVLVTKGPLIDESGFVYGLYGIVRDISEIKRSERNLRDSEALFRSMFENHSAVMMLVDPATGRILDANPAAASFYGYDRAVIKNMLIRQINALPPDEIAAEMAMASQNKKNYFVFPHRLASGEIRTIEAYSSTIMLQERAILCSIIHDISDKIRIQSELTGKEEQLTYVLEGANDGFWDWNIASGEVIFSERWATMLGYDPGEIPPHVSSWEMLVHPDDMAGVREKLEEHLSGRTANYSSEHRLLKKNGDWLWILDRGKVVEWDCHGLPVRAAGTHSDIHERYNAQETVRMMREHLEELVLTRTGELAEAYNRLRAETAERRQSEEWLKSLSIIVEKAERSRIARDMHDSIGQSIYAIKFALEVLEKDCIASSGCNKADTISDLIADISSVSEELRDIIVALNPTIVKSRPLDEALNWLCGKIQSRNEVKIAFEGAGGFDSISSSIKLAYFRICQEALNNMQKHSNATRVSVKLRNDSGLLSLTVQDNGCGGAAFSTDTQYSGSGMAIMKERMELIEGRLTVNSPAGGGTVIHAEVHLP